MLQVLQGKKTYIIAALMFLFGVYVALYVDVTLGGTLILAAGGMTTLGDKLNRHQRELIDGLQAIRQVAVEKKPLTPQQKTQLAGDALSVATEVAAAGSEAALLNGNPAIPSVDGAKRG